MTAMDDFLPLVCRRVTEKDLPAVVSSEPTKASDEDRPQSPAAPCACAAWSARSEDDRIARQARELAIRFAGEACARALGHALVKNPLFVRRFVDDAIAAAGAPARPVLRLNASDAQRVERLDCELVVDTTLSPGDVVVETSDGRVEATLEERAQTLVRAIADP